MSTIDGLGPTDPLPQAGRTGARPRRTEGFGVPQDDPAAAAATGGSAGVGQACGLGGLDALLALQEAADPAARDRAARRRAQDLVHALSALQRALLAEDEAAAVAALESLLHEPPVAADPVLADLAAAVTLRARVELARRGR